MHHSREICGDSSKFSKVLHLLLLWQLYSINRVPNAFPESNSMIFPWFSMTLASFFHDRRATTLSSFNTGKRLLCVLDVAYLHPLMGTLKLSNNYDTGYNSCDSLNNLSVLVGMLGAQIFFSMIFPYRYFEIPWFFHDFGLFFKFHDFSRSGKCFFHFPGFPWFSRPLGTL